MKTISISTVTVAFASQTLTVAVTPTDNDTVTIGNKVYTAKTTLGTTEGQVLIGGSAANFLINLLAAIDHTGTAYPSNTKYYCSAAHTQVEGGAITATTLVVKALQSGTAANSYATTETFASGSNVWGNTTLLGGLAFSLTGVVTEAEVSRPAQQITVGEYPPDNRAFIRQQRLTNTSLQCIRPGVGVALLLPEWSKIAMAIEPTLTYAPKVLTQPSDVSVAAGVATTFSVTVSSETAAAATYLWQYSADSGVTWATATGTVNATDYTTGTTATLNCDTGPSTATGYYHRCLITNAVGTTASNSAILTIT